MADNSSFYLSLNENADDHDDSDDDENGSKVKFQRSRVSLNSKMVSQSVDNSGLAHFVSEHKIPLDCREDPTIYLSPMAGILSDYFW